MVRKLQPEEVERQQTQTQSQPQATNTNTNTNEQTGEYKPDDIEKAIADVEKQIEVAWNDERKNQLQKELEDLKARQQAK